MADPTETLFTGLARRGHQALLEKAHGRVRFDLEHDGDVEHWMLDIRNGEVTVSRGETGDADTVVRAKKEMFDRIAAGEVNPIAAMLRGVAAAEGDLYLLTLVERLLPGPPNAHDPRKIAGVGRRQHR
jgi:putative sterol carrier protein